LSIIFDKHRPLPQYVEHDPAEEQWRCNAADQPIKYCYPSTPFPELGFTQKPDDPHQWDANRYLEDANLSEYKVKKISRKFKRVRKKLTFQLLARRLDNLNKIGITFL
jgi:hypothetical protein